MFNTNFAKITFYYRNNMKQPVDVTIPGKDIKTVLQRLSDKSGILVIKDIKIDLIIIDKVLLEFFTDITVK